MPGLGWPMGRLRALQQSLGKGGQVFWWYGTSSSGIIEKSFGVVCLKKRSHGVKWTGCLDSVTGMTGQHLVSCTLAYGCSIAERLPLPLTEQACSMGV